jgi:shikimate dehydrogenase
MVYSNTRTPFLQVAQGLGAQRLADGLGMLVGQAAESFYIWRGVKPDTVAVLNALRTCKV